MAYALAVIIGIALAVSLPGLGIVVLFVYVCLYAWESRRLKNHLQLNDWRWEHDIASLRRAAYAYKSGSGVSFLRPRRFHGRR
jgi:hypothetical protein